MCPRSSASPTAPMASHRRSGISEVENLYHQRRSSAHVKSYQMETKAQAHQNPHEAFMPSPPSVERTEDMMPVSFQQAQGRRELQAGGRAVRGGSQWSG